MSKGGWRAAEEGSVAVEDRDFKRDETDGYVVLIGGRTAATLAREFEPRLRARERQHPAIHERVVNDDIGL